ncbi:acetyl-coenzyme A transporter 1 [Centruroides vittatus]|uniref:acetyl-coenzyme A transporter 1 n=1 Tax=Centruroides vittatus TaxID=120091 RepID=UPI0035108F9A
MENEARKRRSDDVPETSSTYLIARDENEADMDDWSVGDRQNIILLLILYVLQGIPLGLGGSIPLVLQNRNISYKEQAMFSFAHWPFSIKLIWAPVVDSQFCTNFGRRKSWLIPTQYLIGLFMLVLSGFVPSLLGGESEEERPNVFLLTLIFFLLNFLAATQDVAVDGWALTMLSRRNVGYASTCNSVGQTAGYFLGNVVFLALESKDFCNTYLRMVPKEEGLVTLSGFLSFWGVIFLITTTLIMVFKKERETRRIEEHNNLNLKEAYVMLYRVLCLPSVLTLGTLLLTCKIGFSATDAVTGLKLIEAGVARENLALLAIPMVPLQILLPLLISRYTVGPRPLDVFLKAYPYRLLFGVLLSFLVYWTHLVRLDNGSFPFYYYIVILLGYAIHQITIYSIFVALMAFFAMISDPAMGGTYMTLLNTVSNLGGNWPSTVALWFVDPLTFKECKKIVIPCINNSTLDNCHEMTKEECITILDGYYVECVVCLIIGLIWLYYCKRKITYLQLLPPSAWKC